MSRRVLTESRVQHRVVQLEALGFLGVIAIVWADEVLDLPHVLLGAPATPLRLQEAVLESSLIALLGFAIIGITLRLVRRIVLLESFVTLCAWCRRVSVEGEWMSFESFLLAHKSSTSHGICEECERRLDAAER